MGLPLFLSLHLLTALWFNLLPPRHSATSLLSDHTFLNSFNQSKPIKPEVTDAHFLGHQSLRIFSSTLCCSSINEGAAPRTNSMICSQGPDADEGGGSPPDGGSGGSQLHHHMRTRVFILWSAAKPATTRRAEQQGVSMCFCKSCEDQIQPDSASLKPLLGRNLNKVAEPQPSGPGGEKLISPPHFFSVFSCFF